jgi:hypothetical protein
MAASRTHGVAFMNFLPVCAAVIDLLDGVTAYSS